MVRFLVEGDSFLYVVRSSQKTIRPGADCAHDPGSVTVKCTHNSYLICDFVGIVIRISHPNNLSPSL